MKLAVILLSFPKAGKYQMHSAAKCWQKMTGCYPLMPGSTKPVFSSWDLTVRNP
jgi:hypothetical protein